MGCGEKERERVKGLQIEFRVIASKRHAEEKSLLKSRFKASQKGPEKRRSPFFPRRSNVRYLPKGRRRRKSDEAIQQQTIGASASRTNDRFFRFFSRSFSLSAITTDFASQQTYRGREFHRDRGESCLPLLMPRPRVHRP